MAGVPLKFRCYQCNRLLGVSPSKVGSVVSCPKCGAELVVPPPAEENETAEDVTSVSSPFDPPPGTRDGGLSFDLLDIRPEDIRVEPGVEPIPYPRSEPEPPRPAPEVPIFPREPAPLPPAPPEPAAAPSVLGRAAVETRDDDREEPIIPPIRLDAPRSAASRTLPVRSRDVVLPRSAVATWSLFVLLAQGLAFLAGLLAGHFLWRVH